MEKANLPSMVLATYLRKDELFLSPGASFRSHVLMQPCMQARQALPPQEVVMGWYEMPCLGNKHQTSEKGMIGALAPTRCFSGEQAGHHAAQRETECGKSHMSILQVLPGCSWGKCELYPNEELVCKK